MQSALWLVSKLYLPPALVKTARCKLHVVLDVESGHLTQHIIMGSVEEAGLDSGTQNVNSEPASTGTVGGRSDIYVQPLSSTELEALFPSIWFHGTQNDENGAAQWLTR